MLNNYLKNKAVVFFLLKWRQKAKLFSINFQTIRKMSYFVNSTQDKYSHFKQITYIVQSKINKVSNNARFFKLSSVKTTFFYNKERTKHFQAFLTSFILLWRWSKANRPGAIVKLLLFYNLLTLQYFNIYKYF